MIKFSGVENEDGDSERETNFVRQKTPHPKELKAKAHKLFGASPHKGDNSTSNHQDMNGKESVDMMEDEGIHQEDEEDEIAYKGNSNIVDILEDEGIHQEDEEDEIAYKGKQYR
jgi:protein scribble